MMVQAFVSSVEPRKRARAGGAAAVKIAHFRGAGGVTEWHITVVPDAAGSFEEHLAQVADGYLDALAAVGLDLSSAVWRRMFCSDIANQEPVLRSHPLCQPACANEACAVSLVGQAPLVAAKLALWACHLADPAGPLEKSHAGTTLGLRRGGLLHQWSTGMAQPAAGSVNQQSHAVLDGYAARLEAGGLTLADHCVRTWLFQPYIDLDYQSMVAARREFFARHGLTAATHFIASTGIAGGHALPGTRVFMDAYAIGGLHPGQVNYLTALDHLGPTSDYGVTFERATAVAYQDRRQVFISGTASIDPQGDIVHPGDVVRQLDRTLGNIQSLLAAAGAGLADMLVFLVYLRDPGDHARVLPVLRERLGDVPMVVLHAAVCRPGWLIEIEGVAAVAAEHPALPPF
ncbi:MAG: Rid family hydrolase [Verrucomicrobiota bacterium]